MFEAVSNNKLVGAIAWRILQQLDNISGYVFCQKKACSPGCKMPKCRARSIFIACIASAIIILVIDDTTTRKLGSQSAVDWLLQKTIRYGQATVQLPTSCNLTQFHMELDLDVRYPVVPRHLVGNCTGILYNRVPKCASRFLKDLFESVITANNHTLIFVDSTYVAEQFHYLLMMRHARGRFVLVSHFYFVDFNRLYKNNTLIYINLVRDPIEWFKSLYFFHQHGYRARPFSEPLGTEFNQPISECVRQDTCYLRIQRTFSPLRFMCGPSAACGEASEVVLQKVKATIERHYLMVGVYEDLPAVNMVLEYLLPQVFANLTNAFIPMATQESMTQSQATIGKETLDNDTQAFIRHRMKYDYELYQFAKQRFYNLHRAIETLKSR